MKLTKSRLKQIIKEELKIVLEQRPRHDLPTQGKLLPAGTPEHKAALAAAKSNELFQLQPLDKEDEQYYSDSIASASEDEAVENAVNAVYERIGWALKCHSMPAAAEKEPESKPRVTTSTVRAPNPNAGKPKVTPKPKQQLSPKEKLLRAGGCGYDAWGGKLIAFTGEHVWPNCKTMEEYAKAPYSGGSIYQCRDGTWHKVSNVYNLPGPGCTEEDVAVGKKGFINEQRSGVRPKLDYCGKTYKKDVQLILSFLPTRLFPKFISVFNAQKNQLPQLDSAIDNIFGTADVSSGATAADFAHDALMIASALSGDASSSRRKKTGRGEKPWTSQLDFVPPPWADPEWRAKRRVRMQAQSLKTLSRAKKESIKLIKQQCERDGPGSFACYEKWNIETNIKRGRDPFADERHWKKRWKRAKARK